MSRKRTRRQGATPKSVPPAAVGAATPSTARVAEVDAARGIAIAMMIAYHFCFDLTYYGWTHWPMLDDARWIACRSTIVTGFLLLVGVSLALRADRERRHGRFAWFERGFVVRWLQIAGAALLVTAGSSILFPDSFIYFGVLHFVAVALWLCRLAPRLGVAAIPLGLAVVAVGLAIETPVFDPRWLDWIGFAATKPITEDYVPLFPWLGVVLVGCGLGAIVASRRTRPSRAPGAPVRALATAGRWSLTIYLVHQPLLLGAMGVLRRWS